MDKKKDYIKNKWFYSWKFLVILSFLTLLLYISTKTSILLLCVLYILESICWLVKLIFIPKNKTRKYGIVFLINNSEYYNQDIDDMFKKIQFELQDTFKILVFNTNFISRFDNFEKTKKTFFGKNYHMIINSFSLNAKENSENVCSLTNKEVTFLTPIQKLDETVIKALQKDFSFGFKKIVKISEKNSLTDIYQNADSMALSIRYLVSIVYILFNKIDLAEKQLGLMNFANVNSNDKIIQYLRKNVIKRYAEIYYVKILIKLSEFKYLYDEFEYAELVQLMNKYSTYIDSSPDLVNFRYYLKDFKAKACFAEGDYYSALGYLNELKKHDSNDCSTLLSIAFVKINIGSIKGFEYYKRVSKRKDLDISIVNECIGFIDNALNSNIHNKETLMLCKGVLLYYWVDQEEGIALIDNSLERITNDNIVKFVKVRFNKGSR